MSTAYFYPTPAASFILASLRTIGTGFTMSHSNSRPYFCGWGTCGQSFKRKSDLERHTRIHTNERPFPCSQCAAAFKQKSALTVHIRTHTGEKPYQCKSEFCGKFFADSSSLSRHRRTRHKEEQDPETTKSGQGKAASRRRRKIDHRSAHAIQQQSADTELHMPTPESRMTSLSSPPTPTLDATEYGMSQEYNFGQSFSSDISSLSELPPLTQHTDVWSSAPRSSGPLGHPIYVPEQDNPAIATMVPAAIPRHLQGQSCQPARPHVDVSFTRDPSTIHESPGNMSAVSYVSTNLRSSFADSSTDESLYLTHQPSPVDQVQQVFDEEDYPTPQTIDLQPSTTTAEEPRVPVTTQTMDPRSSSVEFEPWYAYQSPLYLASIHQIPTFNNNYVDFCGQPKLDECDVALLLPSARLDAL